MKAIQSIFTSLIWLVVLLFVSASTSAQDQNTQAIVTGKVINQSDKALTAVSIHIPELSKGTVTNKEGRFKFNQLPTGTYIVTFSRVGYATHKKQVVLEKGETSDMTIRLQRSDMQLQEVTVTGTPQPTEMLETSKNLQMLSGREKQRIQSASLGGSLEQMGGVSNISTGTQFGKPVIRGLSGNRIRVLTNGFHMDYQQYGVRHMPAVDPLLSERIELVQGPSSVLYGSDALGGAINLLPAHIPHAGQKEGFIAGQVNSEFHSNNTEWSTGLKLKGSVGGFGATAAFVKRSGDNINTPSIETAAQTGDAEDPKFTDELPHTDFEQLNGMAGVGYNSAFGNVNLRYLRWDNEHNFLLPNGKGLGQRITNDMAQAKGNIILGNNNVLKPGFSYLRNHRKSNPGGQTRDQLPDDGRAHLDIVLESYTGRLELQHGKVGPLSGRGGLEYIQQEQNTRGTKEPLVPDATIQNFSAFVFEEAKFGQWSFNAGLRYDHREQEADPNETLNLPDQSEGETRDDLTQDYDVVSGSFGVNYRLLEELSFSANIGRGFRAPSIFNLHVDGVHGGVAAFQKGDPNLEEETSLNTDLSIKWRSDRTKVQLTGYRNAIDNYIFLFNTGEKANNGNGPPILQAVQGDATLWGGYIDGKVQLLEWLQFSGGFELVRGENTDDDLANVDDLPLLPADKLNGSVKLMQQSFGKVNNAYLSLGFTHTLSKDAAGRYEPFWQFGNLSKFPFGVASTDSYTLFNAGFGFTFPFYGNELQLDVTGKNLLNTAYRDFLDTYKGYALSPGRNISVKISIPFDTRSL